MPLFEGVSYHISRSLGEQQRSEIVRILDANGATEVTIDRATHVVSDTIEFEGCDTLEKDVPCVTPYWVERSMELGQLQDPKYFSANKELIFSGVVATSAGLPSGDKEVIAAGIQEQGGAWRECLTRDVTHLFVTNTRSEKYETAMHFRNSARITVLLPHWFDQCWTTQMRLPSDVFEFPDPAYTRMNHDSDAYKAQMLIKKPDANTHLGNGLNKETMFRTMLAVDLPSSTALIAQNIWQGRKVLLSSSLALDTQRRESVETRIRRTGGYIVATMDEEECVAVERADVLVTRFRTGPVYAKALAHGKTIGTLAWLFYVQRTGVISRPRDQLLHYPVRNKPIPGFADHEITVTNYQGDAREYLKKLIEIMGAKFTPTMSGRNTIVIAAYKSGNKTTKAEEWSVPIVTHQWLEDCFVEWRNLTPALKKYIDYAPGVNYGSVLGDRGVGRVGLKEDPELLPEKEKQPVPIKEPPSGRGERETQTKVRIGNDGEGLGPVDTGTSTREAFEVAEVEDALHLGGDHDDDPKNPSEVTTFTPIKVGPPRGIQKTPAKDSIKTPSAKPKSKPKPKPITATLEVEDEDKDDGDDVALPLMKRSAAKQSKTIPRTTRISDEQSGPNQSPSDAEDEPGTSKEDPKEKASAMKGQAEKPKPKPQPTRRRVPVPENENEEGSAVEAQPSKKSQVKSLRQKTEENMTSGTSNVVSKPTLKPKPKLTSNKRHRRSELNSDRESVNEDESKAKPGIAQPDPTDAYEEEAFRAKLRPNPKLRQSNARALTPISVDTDDDDDRGSIADASPRVKAKPSPRTYSSRAKSSSKAKASAADSDSDNKVQPVLTRKVAPAGRTLGTVKNNSKTRFVPSPNRVVSVDLPDPRSLLVSRLRHGTPETTNSTYKGTTSPAKGPAKNLARTTSVHAVAYEAPVQSPKRGRPSAKVETTSRSPTPSPRRSPRRPLLADRNTIKHKPRKTTSPTTSEASSPTPPPIQRTPSRRSAAAAASQRLRNEVMPDVMNFKNERRRGARDKGGHGRKRKGSHHNVMDEDEDDEIDLEARTQKRRKVAKGNDNSGKGTGKGKTAGRHGTEDSDTAAGQFITHTKNTKRSAPIDEDVEVVYPGRIGHSGARKKLRMEDSDSHEGSEDEPPSDRSSWDPKKIRILTTKIEVSEHVERALSKLGVKFTQKPHECTHLVTRSLVRTEKFLCALANVPYVLSEEWLTACAESQSIVAEAAYALKDPDTEHKFNFTLAEALARAKELKRNKEKLLQGHFFYFTPNVPLDFILAKTVLQTYGAECKQQTPTMRNVSETRHVISCLKDEKVWRPLAEHGVPIYSHELVLMAALAQYVDWDGDDKRLPGST